MENGAALRHTVTLVALLNLAYFGVEFAVALAIGSVSLFADSIDFLEDATVNGLILIALGWSARRRSIVGMLLAGILFAPGVDAMGEFHPAAPPGRAAAVADRVGSARGQPVLRFPACSIPRS